MRPPGPPLPRSFTAGGGDDGIPVISADDPAYADELGDDRITFIEG